ncbi:chain-length determining protein [Anaerocolumna cellulosilytica]|uniref:Chain-length determining protein n=1 Tax=Anaerocolumna cellulosilytica TaxID=433286 RepID=A0A6S6RCS5_9FIRM|nr:Wzz/FepE/Etk N-terminal domain-containing protein [Anaerocolumna cellulosilytica]MBB5195147.1 capsular polysaccharide biosynthesis protein [Anaerocolumna cellulosilytica]BCJ96618.1 chain-length determining protein [Anaerocolumna cellulosilytica]
MEKNSHEIIELDFKELFYILLGRVWIIVFSCILCALSAGIYTKARIRPMYQSTASLYVINRQDEKKTTSYSDLQTGTQLTKDFQILVKSRPVTEQVISDLGLATTHEELVSHITVTTPLDTRILEVAVNYPDPYTAKKIADAICFISAERMAAIMEIEKANIVESGNIPVGAVSPSLQKNMFLGGAAGGLVATFFILFFYFLDDTIRTGEDVEKHLGLTILGTIPEENGILNSKKVKAELKKAYKKGYRGGNNNAIY